MVTHRSTQDPPRAVPGRPFTTFLRYNRPYWPQYAVGSVIAVFFVGTSLLMPWIVRAIVAAFREGAMTGRVLLGYFAVLLSIAAVSGIARYFQRRLMIGASRRFEYDLRNDYFRRVQSLSASFFHRTATGDIMARATNDLNYVRDFVGPGIMGTVDMIRLPFTLGMMLFLSVRLTLFALVPLPLVSVLVYFFVQYMNRQSKRVQELFSQVTKRVQENLAGARVVKAYGIADRELRTFRKASQEYMRANIRLVAVMSFAWPLIGLLIGAAILLIIWQGGQMVIHGEYLIEDLIAFIILMVMLAFPLAQFGWVLTLYQRGAVGMNRISEILNEQPDILDTEATVPGRRVGGGGIRFHEVSFQYHEGVSGAPRVLEDVDFEVSPGQTVAIVGPTGSGKSTIVSLITREFDPVEGAVLIDGQDARTIPLEHLRAAIGYVPQDTFVFSDSIRENIRFGRPDASDEAIQEACETAQFATELASMPGSLDTLLGERGINLSGGQKQRLTLARAVLRDPKILILDDALSSVDTHTEERILSGLRSVMAGRTCVLIAHRISTVREADHILVVDEGRIVERGSHDNLVAQDGLYAAMHRRQLLESAIEDAGRPGKS